MTPDYLLMSIGLSTRVEIVFHVFALSIDPITCHFDSARGP